MGYQHMLLLKYAAGVREIKMIELISFTSVTIVRTGVLTLPVCKVIQGHAATILVQFGASITKLTGGLQ